jgi:hypothetical protein
MLAESTRTDGEYESPWSVALKRYPSIRPTHSIERLISSSKAVQPSVQACTTCSIRHVSLHCPYCLAVLVHFLPLITCAC